MKIVRVATVMALSSLPAVGSLAKAQVVVDLPSIRFETAPPLEVVEPGVQVVPDQPEEVYFVDGWYWTRHGGRWFRSHDYRGGWAVAEPRYVPDRIAHYAPGRYAHWHPARRAEERHDARVEHREERRDERREEERR